MILKYAAIIERNRISNRYQSKCIFCGGNHSTRILLVLEHEGKRIKKSICFSVGQPDFRYFSGSKPYKQMFPSCFHDIFNVPVYERPFFAGKVLEKRDKGLLCVECGEPAIGGLWVSLHGVNKYADRRAICAKCLLG